MFNDVFNNVIHPMVTNFQQLGPQQFIPQQFIPQGVSSRRRRQQSRQ
ncbi:hypothetical protein [Rhodococcus qingshengii]|nr:hypothetical protein [Rhodococcus qingshengii]MCT6732771.1 hypothetical protein [Rhodococcus qingshengii]